MGAEWVDFLELRAGDASAEAARLGRMRDGDVGLPLLLAYRKAALGQVAGLLFLRGGGGPRVAACVRRFNRLAGSVRAVEAEMRRRGLEVA